MPDPVDLSYCMTLPPKEAIAYLKGKGYAITLDWEEMWQAAHAKAFTVAKATRLDILEDIRKAVEKALAEGKTGAWFERELKPILQGKGWWGRQEHIDQGTGEITQVQLGSPWRLETIYRVNLQTAYMAGRYQEQMANVDDRPYWQYVAVMDRRTRQTHRALNGKVFRFDDPFWQSFYPPNGWRCRCRVRAVSGDNLKDRGQRVEVSDGKLGTDMKVVSKKTGEMREVATYSTTDPVTLKKITVSPDVGWSYNPGAAYQPDTSRYGGDLSRLAKKELK